MKPYYWVGICAVLFAQLAPAISQNNACGKPLGGAATTKCVDCKKMTICATDEMVFNVQCLPNEYCLDVPEMLPITPGGAMCAPIAPPAGCEPDTATETPPPTGTTTPASGTTTPPEEGSVICSGSGIYPDATNCSIYHYCSAANEPSLLQECPPGYVFYYTSTSTGVFPCKSGAVCNRANCTEGKSLVPYGTNKIFYAQCTDGVATIYSCGSGGSFNGEKCAMSCTQEGIFPNTVNTNEYYRCYYSGSTLVSKTEKCPTGKNFDVNRKICV
ncbi:uncharacterized protein LOC128735605 [Sabethes cyaneus]|uniref:uncharacterized protein LOC128735605 n=1 Tax=Sabethes cyaneus TaxID=53552 RepID=UPI00237E3E5C|nr:uncharacterized protein LOC128735605 [Sabethes cyaneus]